MGIVFNYATTPGASPGFLIRPLQMRGQVINARMHAYPPKRDCDAHRRPDKERSGVTRGGDYQYDNRPETLTASHRNGFSNESSQGHRQIGLRCAAGA